MEMGISAMSRHDMDHISETPFRHRVVEPNISTLNQSPKADILQVQPPSLSKILLYINLFLSICIVSLSEGFTPEVGLYIIHLTCCLSCFLSG
ncbi:hypothetical protein R3W88_027037 [Solanum pinnatisectum]|uniref:Uncharacterized protein n=1 Tax=Solanum pinnatisectum TaxID=50273 RepID=A0AAV9LG57_9SOLN|nr:hypothetical protein R3W88_027037 [Solanum pinnatisectum]